LADRPFDGQGHASHDITLGVQQRNAITGGDLVGDAIAIQAVDGQLNQDDACGLAFFHQRDIQLQQGRGCACFGLH